MFEDLQRDIKKLSNPERAAFFQRFFKTQEGQYGYGDKFLGFSVPNSRLIAKKYRNLSLNNIEKMLRSEYHEERLIALFILVLQFKSSKDPRIQKEIFDFYLSHTKYVNNWDLVDSSADKIVGQYLINTGSNINLLRKLAKSDLLWERRIAMIATFQFLKNGDSKPTYEIADMLINDKHDLIQKAVGWMLREAGKKISQQELISFLSIRYKTMPRTALRYSIEHFKPEVRKKYLQGLI